MQTAPHHKLRRIALYCLMAVSSASAWAIMPQVAVLHRTAGLGRIPEYARKKRRHQLAQPQRRCAPSGAAAHTATDEPAPPEAITRTVLAQHFSRPPRGQIRISLISRFQYFMAGPVPLLRRISFCHFRRAPGQLPCFSIPVRHPSLTTSFLISSRPS